ncbi:hypothetical protein Esti_004743 [Eimeria stiedai]
MLGVIAWTSQLAFALCLATDVDLGLPGGLLGIFGYGEGLPGAVPLPASRFLAVQAHEADEAKSDRRDDLRAQFEVRHSTAANFFVPSCRAFSLTSLSFNMKQAAVLEAEATKQEDEARQIKQLVEAVKLSASNSKESLVTECEILKIGPLTFVTNVTINLLGFTFPYRGTEQVFCAPSPMARDSWIDVHAEAKLEPIPPPVNGLEQPIGTPLFSLKKVWKRSLGHPGEHMVFDVEKFAKEGGQPEEQAVSQAALDISKRAEQVASKIESSAATTELPSLHKEAETEITVDSEETAPEETKAEEEENEEAEQEESDQDE